MGGRKARVWFFNHKYDYTTEFNDKKSCYQLMITITISEEKKHLFEKISWIETHWLFPNFVG